MGWIYGAHGICDPDYFESHVFSCRNYLNRNDFERYLQSREPFAPASIAERASDALTIDDATIGGWEMAMLARRHGSDVTWFLNPSIINSGIPYHFARLAALLDTVSGNSCEWQSDRFDLTDIEEREQFRSKVKNWLNTANSVEEMHCRIEILESEFQSHCNYTIPPFASVVSGEHVKQAVAEGVQLGNHLWEHISCEMLTSSAITESAQRTDEWLCQFTRQPSEFIAIPYGEPVLKDMVSRSLERPVLYLTKRMQPGRISSASYNRITLKRNHLCQ